MSEESYDVRKTEPARSDGLVSDKNEGGPNRPTCEGILAARLLENLWARKRQQVFNRKEQVHLSKRAANIPPKTAVQRRAPRDEAC